MPWSGGVFNRLNGATGWVDDANAFIGIEATRHDTQDNDFRDGINACLNKDGSNAATGNQNFANYRLTAVGAATARTDAPQAAQVQDGDFIWLGTTGGTATAQTATATPAITAYKAGQKFRCLTGFASTGATNTAHTLNVNGIGAKNIVNNVDSTNPTIGSWLSGVIMELIYDGTNFRLINECGGWQNYSPTLTGNAGTITSQTIYTAKWRKVGKTVEVSWMIVFNTSLVGSYVRVPVPVNWNLSASQLYNITLLGDGAGTVSSFWFVENQGNLSFCKNLAGSAWGSVTGAAVYGDHFYPCV